MEALSLMKKLACIATALTDIETRLRELELAFQRDFIHTASLYDTIDIDETLSSDDSYEPQIKKTKTTNNFKENVSKKELK